VPQQRRVAQFAVGRRWAAYTTLTGHRVDVDMAPTSKARTNKPVSKAFEHQEESKNDGERINFIFKW
jgi:hypothetical protein